MTLPGTQTQTFEPAPLALGATAAVDHGIAARSARVKAIAANLGFDLVGIALPERSPRGKEYRDWIAAGHHGAMDYLATNVEKRLDLPAHFPWVKSIVAVGLSYYRGPRISPGTPAAPPPADKPIENGPADGQPRSAKIARYAWGRDYHKVLSKMLRRLEAALRTHINKDMQSRAYVDTGPLLEREIAARAGLGWIGKHTLLLHPRHGSWFVLGELLTNLELAPDTPMTDHCGSCTRCVDACPTAAIRPWTVDAELCISYQSIENRGAVPTALHAPMAEAGYVVGCDICQEVCPYNGNPLESIAPDFAPTGPAPATPIEAILNWDDAAWDQATRGKSHRRVKLPMWQRNARIIADGV